MSILFNKGDVYFGTCIEHCQTTKILCKRDVGHLMWSHFSIFFRFLNKCSCLQFLPIKRRMEGCYFLPFSLDENWPVEFNKVLS